MGLFAELELPCNLEPRLVRRYETLVKEHTIVNPSNAPGVKALANHQKAWSFTQAAWRFFNNDNVTFPMLAEPLFALAREAATTSSSPFLLVAHDWCRCNYRKHNSKLDKTQMSHAQDVGYELQASLLIDGKSGKPLAPLGLNLVSSHGVYQCYESEPQARQEHLDELVGLTRCKKDSTLLHDGKSKRVEQIASSLSSQLIGSVSLRGRTGFLFVGETLVTLKRKTESRPDELVTARLVLSQVVDDKGKELASWYLLSNVTEVSAQEIAQWYCWRWNIESWFKLLKSDGFHVEEWQQTTGEAVFRRLLVSSMACTLALKLYQDESGEAQELKLFLIRLSGRVTKRSKPVTLPALLAGLYQFIQMQEVMSTYPPEELQRLAKIASRYFG